MHMRWPSSISMWALALTLAFAVGFNIQLIRQVNRLTVANDKIRDEMEVLEQGEQLPPLRGSGPNGEALNVEYTDQTRSTVVLVFTRTCPYCLQNWTSWSRLLSRMNPTAARVVAIDLSATADPNYYRLRGLIDIPLFSSVDYRAGRAYKLNRVPTTLLLDGKGMLTGAWSGPLDESALKVLERAVTIAPTAAGLGVPVR